MSKFSNFIKSFRYISLEGNYKSIFFGPEAKEYLKFFKKNYFYVEPTKETIFNIKLVLPFFVFFFFFLIRKPLLTIKYIKISPRLFLLIAFIKIKKINKIITFVDYNEWPKVIKFFLGQKIFIISAQNSSKAYPLNRMLLAKNYDEYYSWNEFKDFEKKELSKTKIIPLGALKSYLVVNDKNLWNLIKDFPEHSNTREQKNLVLISSLHESFLMIYERYLKNKKISEYENILNELETKCKKKKFFGKIIVSNKKQIIPKRMFYYQSIEFFKMCVYVRKFIKDESIKLSIIERNRPGTEMYEFEKIFFEKLFGENYLTNLGVFDKIEHVIRNKNHVFLTNISTLGRETLALNRKSFFFSTLLHFYNPDFFDKDSNFFSIDDNYENFKKSLNLIFSYTSKSFSESKTKLKFTVSSCSIIKDHFEKFLKSTELEII